MGWSVRGDALFVCKRQPRASLMVKIRSVDRVNTGEESFSVKLTPSIVRWVSVGPLLIRENIDHTHITCAGIYLPLGWQVMKMLGFEEKSQPLFEVLRRMARYQKTIKNYEKDMSLGLFEFTQIRNQRNFLHMLDVLGLKVVEDWRKPECMGPGCSNLNLTDMPFRIAKFKDEIAVIRGDFQKMREKANNCCRSKEAKSAFDTENQ